MQRRGLRKLNKRRPRMYQTGGNYETYVSNLKSTKQGIALSEDQYTNAVQKYGVDIVNNMYDQNGSLSLYPSYIKSNSDLGWDPFQGGWDLTSNLQSIYSNIEGVSDEEKEYWSNYDFNTSQAKDFSGFEGRKYKLTSKDGKTFAVLNTDLVDKGEMQGGLLVKDNDAVLTNEYDASQLGNQEFTQEELEFYATEDTWDPAMKGKPGYYNPLNAKERALFDQKWNKYGTSRFGRRITGDGLGIVDGAHNYYTNTPNNRTYKPSYNFGNDVREIDPETNDNLIFYADKDGNPVGTHYTNGMKYTQRILDWRDRSGNNTTLDNAIIDDGSKLKADYESGEDVLYKKVPLAAATVLGARYGPSALGGLSAVSSTIAATPAVAPWVGALSADLLMVEGLTINNLLYGAFFVDGANSLKKKFEDKGYDLMDAITDPSTYMEILQMAPLTSLGAQTLKNLKTGSKTQIVTRGVTTNTSGQIKTSFDKYLTTTTKTVDGIKRTSSSGNIPFGQSGTARVYYSGKSGEPFIAKITIPPTLNSRGMVPTGSSTGGSIQVYQTVKNAGTNVYFIDVQIANELQAGRAMLKIHELIPKGAIVKSTGNLSMDSYKFIINNSKKNKFTLVDNSKMADFNTMAKVHEGSGSLHLSKVQADKAAVEINKMLEGTNVKNRMKVITNSTIQHDGTYINTYELVGPDLGLRVNFKEGGFRKLSTRRPRTY